MRPALSADVRTCERHAEGISAELCLSVPSDVSYVEEAVELVARHVAAHFVDPHAIRFNVRVALSEALANAISYGTGEDATKGVEVRVLFGPHTVQLEVTDEGGGFDYRLQRDPTEPWARLEPRGRGLFLIRNLVDEVRFNATGHSICMILRRA